MVFGSIKYLFENLMVVFECVWQAQFDEYREKIAGLEKELLDVKSNQPSEDEIKALKLKDEGILCDF